MHYWSGNREGYHLPKVHSSLNAPHHDTQNDSLRYSSSCSVAETKLPKYSHEQQK